MAKGDTIEVHISRNGDAVTQYKMIASQNGRTVSQQFEREAGVQWLVIREQTRGGTTVVEHRYPVEAVVAIRETKRVPTEA